MTYNSQSGESFGPIVTIAKRGLPVHIGIVNSQRLLAHGFDVEYPAKIHFRTMKHGPFSVLVATSAALAVRVMIDGKLVCEQQVDPLPQPLGDRGEKSAVRRQVRESMNAIQPFFITRQNDGSLLTFTSDPLGRSFEERLRLQLHPDQFGTGGSPVITMHGGDAGSQAQTGADAVLAGIRSGASGSASPAVSGDSGLGTDTSGDTALGTTGNAHVIDLAGSESGSSAVFVPASAQLPVSADNAQPEMLLHFDLPLPKMAPSYGMIAVGVRLVPVSVEGEPPMAPDSFDWVLFQLNTWEEHNRVRANLHSRIKLPKQVPYREIDDGTQVNDTYTQGDPGCGNSYDFDPRRLR